MTPRPRIYRAGIVALLAAYACFAWPGLYHLAAHVLDVSETLTLPNGWTVHRAWLYPAAVDGGIFVAGCVLLTQPQLAKRLQRELWAGMWSVAALSGLGLVVDTLAKGVGWATPLILAPVVIATWFLHMVVRVQAEAAVGAAGKGIREEVTNAGGSGEEGSGPPAPDPLFLAAQAVAAHLGDRLSRRTLIAGLRERQHKVGTKRAQELLDQLRDAA